MPLLDDSKSVYVGTTPITKVMAGSVQVWPKGPPLPKLPVCPTCKFWQPTDWMDSKSPAMLIPAYQGEKTNRFSMSPNGIDVEGVAVRMALSDDKPLYDGMWTNLVNKKYRCNQDVMQTYPQFDTYTEAISNQELNIGDTNTAIIDLLKIFTQEEIRRLWLQVSYEKTGYQHNWTDVEYASGNYQENFIYIPYSGYRAYYNGFYVYRLGHYFECTTQLYNGNNIPGPNTALSSPFDIESSGVIRPSVSCYAQNRSLVLNKDGSGSLTYMNRYQQIEGESFTDNAPQQVFIYKMISKPGLGVSYRSDRALCDAPAI